MLNVSKVLEYNTMENQEMLKQLQVRYAHGERQRVKVAVFFELSMAVIKSQEWLSNHQFTRVA